MGDIFQHHIGTKPFKRINDIKVDGLHKVIHVAKIADNISKTLVDSVLSPLINPFKRASNNKTSGGVIEKPTPVYTLLDQQTLICLPFTSF